MVGERWSKAAIPSPTAISGVIALHPRQSEPQQISVKRTLSGRFGLGKLDSR